jgi:hypothetical protein
MRKYILALVGSLIPLLLYLSLEEHEHHSLKSIDFTIDRPFLQVVRNLATKNSLERIAEDNDATVTGKYWENFNVEVPQRILRLRDYRLEGTLKFTVERLDPDLGRLRLTLTQNMDLDETGLRLETHLARPDRNVTELSKTVEITPIRDRQATGVRVVSQLGVSKTIPFFLKEHMDMKVDDNNDEGLRRLRERIIEVSEQKGPVTFRARQ